jgi:hypothetical protein
LIVCLLDESGVVMFWMILLYSAAAIAALFLLLLFVFLFSPFYLGSRFSGSGASITGCVRFWWFHPGVISVNYDFTDNSMVLRLFVRSIGKKTETPTAPPSPVEKQDTEISTPESIVFQTPEEEEKFSPEEDKFTSEIVGNPETDFDHGIPEEGISMQGGPEEGEESVEISSPRRDNLLNRLKKNRYLFFLRNHKWRGKITRWVLRMFSSFFRIVSLDKFQVWIKAGLEDPSVTGMIYGFYQALRNGLSGQFQKVMIEFEPVFSREEFHFSGETGIRSSFGRLILPVIVALFTFPYLTTLRLWLRSRKAAGI